ncbi:MAG: hypothetical protein CMJ44_08740 [Pimelobacter sp.]|nr:hypothetical protein [Pimelobacter sp.]
MSCLIGHVVSQAVVIGNSVSADESRKVLAAPSDIKNTFFLDRVPAQPARTRPRRCPTRDQRSAPGPMAAVEQVTAGSTCILPGSLHMQRTHPVPRASSAMVATTFARSSRNPAVIRCVIRSMTLRRNSAG